MGFHASDTDEPAWSDNDMLLAEVRRLKAENFGLRAALYEVTTNGQWTKGEQLGDWAISKEVYETARDTIDGQLTQDKKP